MMLGNKNHGAEANAAQRLQKAKKAKKVKKHLRYRQKRDLLEKLENEKVGSVIVAPELSRPNEDDTSADDAQSTANVTKKRKRDNSKEVAEPTVEEEDKGEGSNTEGQGDLRTEKSEIAEERKEKKVKKRKYIPFEKEMRIHEEKVREREKERERIQKEREEYFSRQEESHRKRKEEGKKFRRVTRKGQPIMKHHVSSLLKRLEKNQNDQH